MVLQRLIAWVLNHFLGKYVENLNTDQLSIGLLQGEVELENLPLKKEALRQVGLPVQVTSGFIGKVKLQIPLRQIRSAPWVILIEKLYLVAAPVNLAEWDEEAEEQALLERKLSVLDAIEVQWRSCTEGLDQSYYASSYMSWMNFGTSIMTNIVENLQLKITDVHIRYEDNLTIDQKYFCFGVVIDSLVAQSCNEDWEPGFSSGENSYKVVELNRLSVYWDDCSPADILSSKERIELIESMENASSRGGQFIVHNISGRGQLKRNRSAEPLRSKTTPRMVCDVSFDDFPITITEKQYSQLLGWQRGLTILQRRIANRHIRPSCPVSESPSKWWKYILKATIESNKTAVTSWDAALKRAQDVIAYVKLHEKLLVNPAGALTEDQKSLKDRVELEQNLDDLRALRLIAMQRVHPAPKSATTSTNYLLTWFPQFWYSETKGGGDLDDERRINEELYAALENTLDDESYLKRDVVFGQFNFSLKQGTVIFCACVDDVPDTSVKAVMEVQLEKVLVGFEWRPRHSSFKFTVSLGAIFLKDRLTTDTVFPVLVAPQGRETAPSSIDSKRNLPPTLSRLLNQNAANKSVEESLFQISFESKPFNSNVDCRLHVKTQSLDIVYNPEALNWLVEFFTKPQQALGADLRMAARRKYQAIKTATKNELIKNWEKIIAGDLSNRKTWDVDLDISAPQIIFVEHFCDKNAVIVVVDLGRVHFSNCAEQQQVSDYNKKRESEDEENFETPCSTPPGSEASPEGVTPQGLPLSQLNELSLHHMLYDRYTVELGDMQVLVGRVRDNWKYAQLKGASSLHVLDRFNISMQIERRIVHTTDPQFPSLTFSGNLPRLVVHVNEQKVSALRAMAAIVTGPSLSSPFRGTPEYQTPSEDFPEPAIPEKGHTNDVSGKELSRLVIMQFTVHQLALEVQSRNRSVAELQVSGVRATLTQRPYDTSITLTVHSLLLVDAMQTFGRDFELLVASHKHVGMDSLSGSLRDSEPTSPTSPGSPEPGNYPASPVAISQALNSLECRALSPFGVITGMSPRSLGSPPVLTSPPPHPPVLRAISPDLPDAEALITVELTFISGACPGHEGQPLQIAAVQFNNLDIIANQETIVELLGFVRRVFPPGKPGPPRPTTMQSEPLVAEGIDENSEATSEGCTVRAELPTRTDVTFDFHRLNVLLLRAVVKGGSSMGRKICTATMMQAKIKATLGTELVVEGSLGGIQVLDLTPEGQRHQRILSLGADPLAAVDTFADMSAGLYSFKTVDVSDSLDNTAFSFSVRRSLQSSLRDTDQVEVKVRLASVWYTHSPNLLKELQSCATEFKQYMSNLARTIKSAATEVAMGFVHSRAEAIALSLYMSNRLSSSLYGGSNPEIGSPRKRRRSFTQSHDNMASTFTINTPFTPHTPRSPGDEDQFNPIIFNLDVVLDTPVIVLPRSPTSDHVFVAHLGKITLRNSYPEIETPWATWVEKYHFDVRDMNLYAVVAQPLVPNNTLSATGDAILPRAEKMYSCAGGRAIVHDTVIEITIERHVKNHYWGGSMDFEYDSSPDEFQQIRVSGGVVGPLKLSLSRGQYEQVIETSNYLLTSLDPVPESENMPFKQRLGDIEEEVDDNTTKSVFEMDPFVRSRAGYASSGHKPLPQEPESLAVGVTFELPEFTVELLGEWGVPQERALVSISFRDFMLHFDRPSTGSSHLQMSLKSLVMEDLLVPEANKNRFLVVSSAAPTPYNRRSALSRSCPSISTGGLRLPEHNSLPENLSSNLRSSKPTLGRYTGGNSYQLGSHSGRSRPPCTPPPSPRPGTTQPTSLSREENLVLINIDTVNEKSRNADDSNNDQVDRTITIDFNCLDVIANIESWVVVFDFFGVESSPEYAELEPSQHSANQQGQPESDTIVRNISSKMDLHVRSLTLVLVRPEYEVAKANISHLTIKTLSALNYNLEGRLGSMSLADLTPHGKLYRERFLTSGKEALHVQYSRYDAKSSKQDPSEAELHIKMSSVVYIHTQRFLNEVYAYFLRFSQLQTLMASMRSTDSSKYQVKPSTRLLISINAGSPVLILPVASNCVEVLVADLGQLAVRNRFRRAGSEGTIATAAPEGTTTVSCLLDVMSIDLMNMDLFAGRRILGSFDGDCLQFGGVRFKREGPSFLPDKCFLKLQVDRNLDTHLTREVPDLSVQGTLAKLEAFLDLSQYKLIRGLLEYNIGENLQDLNYAAPENTTLLLPQTDANDPVWLTMSIHLELLNVMVHLREKHGEGASLACVNFIKSRLVVESFSDRSQDIDLVSAEILLTDTRYLDEAMNKRYNVFTNILQPLCPKSRSRSSSSHKLSGERGKMEKRQSQESDDGTVQAEIHHRRRKDYSKTTILLHNMRVMAVLDWWESVRDFIAYNFELPVGTDARPETNANPLATSTPSSATKAAYHPSLRVANKYPAVVDSDSAPFEFKLNVTDSEIVLVEDTSVWDTNAIILKSTTVISYRPGLLEKPLSCNLNHCEVFSCILGMEDDTALSIIDPVTVNMEIALRAPLAEVRGIPDAMVTSQDRALEVSMHAFTVRLSYHDFRMLARMLDSVPQQTRRARDKAFQRVTQPANVRSQIGKLAALGFSEEDCAGALERCNGQLDDAALWLTQNASHPVENKDQLESTASLSFDTVEVKLGCLSIVVIDDCRDADVPLLELSLSQLFLKQVLGGEGSAKFHFSSDYYNRVLSGWEPFIEPWRCNMKWERSLTSSLSRNRLQIEVFSDDLMNVNITSTLMELYSTVKASWSEDYLAEDKTVAALSLRRRSPFVPFALKNETGCELWFSTLIKAADNISEYPMAMRDEDWTLVRPDETIPFTFEGREKARHRDTHKVQVHQVMVRVGVWSPVSPVTVDKVGVFFRQVNSLLELSHVDIPPARVVFAISLEGTARKLVTVRSALTVNNFLSEIVEVKLENNASYPGVWEDTMCLQIPAGSSLPVPLSHAHAHIWIRPLDGINLSRYHAFSSSPLGWMSVRIPGELVHEAHQCHSNRDNSYRFVAGIYHENYPAAPSSSLWPQPAHVISLYSPVLVTNLLPYDLHYSVRQASVRGHIKPGESASVHELDCEQRIEINLHLEGFPRHGTLTLSGPATSFVADIRLHDDSGRRLVLNATVALLQGAGLRVSISAPFWFVNKTSLPLVVRQEGSSLEAAGQVSESEVARVVTPLLFSLADQDAGPLAQIRVGNAHVPDSTSQWCQPFALQTGSEMLRLKIMQRDRPDVIYTIGMNIRQGRGRHRSTRIITLSPRFQIHNKSSFQLQFAQLCLATTLNDPAATGTYGKAVQDCSLAWHWPRPDKELLLCVRLIEVKHCLWSGGFTIDNDDSFHINIRDINGKMHFLRVEIVLQDATYFTVFTDAESMPPPVRIDNCSQVTVTFYQSDSKIETPRSNVRPQMSVPYAWDLPQGIQKIAVIAPGGCTASCDVTDVSTTKTTVNLTYENFIYIAFTATFNHVDEGANTFEPLDVESQQLVLDCVDGYRVVLNRKQHGARSQLWRMSSEGQLQHEGSSPPRDPKSKSSHSSERTLVLDIAGPAPQPTQCVALVLRRPDPRRASTQTWRFTDSGRLCCAHNNMCVQAKDGFFGLRQGSRTGVWQMWSEAVLGPSHDSPMRGKSGQVPLEQAVSRMKMRPGSGWLAVSVISDGPTRVLRIVDPIDSKGQEKEWSASLQQEESAGQGEQDLTLRLSSGLGISIVSRKPPEELLFIHMRGIILSLGRTPAQLTFDCSIEDIQCDNQLFEPEYPVVLYVTRSYRDDEPKRHLPAVLISAHKQHSSNTNAHIFRHLIISVKSLSVCIEELLLLKLLAMFGWLKEAETEDAEESDFETQRRVIEATSVHAERYYFGILKLTPDQIRLSVATSAKLPQQPLQLIKKKLALRLIKFEEAAVDLKEFKRRHPFETSQCLLSSIVKHFKSELRWQAAAILGTVDFLGNPLGLINDVSEGMTGLFTEGNVGALVKSVTHGLSNSAAKVTETLSDGLGRVIMDDSHEEARQRIRKAHSGSSRDHLWAGVKGLGFGMLGGMTSIFKQTYEGAAQEGIQGLLAGFGKGIVGTVTKPMVGVLDLASETASAVRDSSRSSDRPSRYRLARLVLGPGGLMPPYSAKQAQGQEFLYNINNRDYSETLVSYDILLSEGEDLRILISSENILLFTSSAAPVVQYHLSDLCHSQAVSFEDPQRRNTLYYVELVLNASGSSVGLVMQDPPKKRPRIRCDSSDIAERVAQQINYARTLFEETRFTVSNTSDG